MNIIGPYTPWEPPHEINSFGTQYWYKDHTLHREDGPAVIFKNGTQIWYKDSIRHSDDGPAVIRSNGDQYWYKDDKIHREDGPAVIYTDGTQYWYKDDEDITYEVKQWAEQCNIDLDNMSDSDKFLLKIFMNGL